MSLRTRTHRTLSFRTLSFRTLSFRALTLRAIATLVAGAIVLSPAVAHAAAPSPDPSSDAGSGTTWALQPASPDGADGRVSLRHTVDAGGVVQDRIALSNFGSRPASFAVYASDGTVGADGNFDLIPASEEATDGGTWIDIAAPEASTARDEGGIVLEVPAASTVVIPVQITVPANATPGDHPAGIVAELVSAAGTGVQFASRVGVRAHLRVAGDIVGEISPEVIGVSYTPSWNPFAPGTVDVDVALANAGNVRLGADAVTTAAGVFGIGRADASVAQREILPGDRAGTRVRLEVWPLFFSWGDVETTPLVVGEDAIDDVTLASARASFGVWTVPWSQLVLLLVLVGGFFGIRRLRTRSRARVQAQIDAAVAAATLSSQGR